MRIAGLRGDACRRVAASCAELLAHGLSLSSAAFGPGSQSTFSASRPSFAAQKWSATTATPLGTCTTLRTPGTALAAVASNDFTLPPNTGARATTAVSRPSNCTSMPNCARPVIFSGVSRRLVGLPMSFQSLASFSVERCGSGAGSLRGGVGELAVARALVAGDHLAVLGADLAAGTSKRCAAACTSSARAVAPAWR